MITNVTKQYDDINPNEVIGYVMVKNGITSFVPNNEANTDYQAIQEWAAIEGNNIIDPGA
jgi:hypothetical protein